MCGHCGTILAGDAHTLIRKQTKYYKQIMAETTCFSEFLRVRFPMVKIFDFDKEHYLIYDAKPNVLFSLTHHDFDAMVKLMILQDRGDLVVDELTAEELDLLERLTALEQRGVMCSGPLSQLFDTSGAAIEDMIEYYRDNIFMRKFVIEVTERCNMACRYCPNTHTERTRHHTDRQMSHYISQRSVDFYFELYAKFFGKLPDSHRKKFLKNFPPTIGFYGGETFLNWDVMEKAILYYENLDWETCGIPIAKLMVTINTNLYLLKEEWLDFIIKHRPILFVSLDGPREENDKNRVDLAGNGTFERVFRNLMRIKDKDENYYKEKVFILTTEALGNNIGLVHEFIDGLGLNVIYSPEQPFDSIVGEPEKRIEELENDLPRRTGKAMDELIEKFEKDSDCSLEPVNDVSKLCGISTSLPPHKKEKNVFMSCPLCFDNIMIGVDGSFHFCHKTDGSLPLGNIIEGFNEERLRDAYRQFATATNNKLCRSCWAVNQCYYCAANWLRDGKFRHPHYADCRHLRASLEQSFKVYIELYKRKPELLDKLWEQRHNLDHHQGILDINKFLSSPV